MLDWLKKKSGEHQTRNATRSLGKLIAAADVLDEAWAAKREPTPNELAAFNKNKGDFCLDMIGPIPLEDIKRELIDPSLAGRDANNGARMAVISAYEYTLKKSR